MRTSEEYRQDLYKLKPNVYVRGKKVRRDSPEVSGGINVISKTFDLVEHPDYKDFLTTKSHISGKRINRFTHINQSAEDLLKKQLMTRKLCRLVGGCIQRCMGCDAINGLSVATFAADTEHGTDYHKRFLEYVKEFQERDLVAACAQTDVKGDRSKRPHQQDDPDMYVRVVERRSDGIVVRGAKNCITMAAVADEIIVVPTRAMTPEDKDYSVAFAVPADTEGVKIVARTSKLRAPEGLKMPQGEIGDDENMIIFDDVFVPWDRVFLCGENKYATLAAHLFALFHRHSYTGCKPATTDMIMGFGALIAEYNGVYEKHNIREKLVELAATAELVFAAGVAAAHYGQKSPAGTFIPNEVYANVGRRHAGLNYYKELEILAELSGGLPAALPFAEDFLSEEVGPYIRKYIKRRADVPAEHVYRCLFGISNILCSSLGGVQAVAGVHGGGSPVMEEIAIWRSYDFEKKKDIAKYLSGISEELPRD
ncbi:MULTISPECIES: 4-hydroxyphenylacetate 3-hydroxylase family protein [Archaeoglobus]|jgi:4-hydroxyphenylacetate 3-monooxygenase/4-hydroxybutyryl-CoA dehydratase/vinylacetyl-CoA-Delta-isomerase|uniref:4-hydroxyphenylacetate-3-hydroxylase (HpaA-3) n=1 Tax=Archaeoglobus fulgidus TaxID=2234 RepID=A0A101DYM0_ARCFL|nr:MULTISPECIES: 4-hydroxyphenylacetate 3-hydroxylase family protein [Archaeoglobus]KUJ94019.1 MAG: 4-hydroxyphenylacetate-3-hydroxylase (HpaA-3) [Archaeoglobus fulgidus]KUK05402.1 MAG: 4-hydroxyphenylacetate-3-hydroxylase (HpaA-3) [Archaeoglobus fulgidus]MDI3497497.1 4-hydroxybutyryl-CoA dehydratase / vinylacetyl-CoA-Delta-isomerase [Archaeoglobus sp.]